MAAIESLAPARRRTSPLPHSHGDRGRSRAGTHGSGCRGEVRFDAGSRALYATDASNYRQVPIGLVVPRDAEDVVAAVAACRRVRRAGAAARRRHEPRRPVLQRRGRPRLHEVHEPDPGDRSGPAVRARPAGRRPRHAAEPRREAPADIRSRSVHAQPLHARRDDRQQLVRHALAARRQDGRQRRGAARSALRRHRADGGRDERRGARRDRRGRAAAAATSTRRCARFAIGTPIGFARGFPQIPRRVSGYNLDELLPERGFHVARALVGSEGTCAIVLDAKVTLIRSPQHRSLVGLGYRRRVRRGRSRAGDSRVHSRSASKASRARWSTACG